MDKDFDAWNTRKKEVHEAPGRVLFRERDVWFSHVGVNVGSEVDGKGGNFGRPVIVFRKFNNEVFWAVPLTTKDKTGRFYLPVDLHDGRPRYAVLSQMRLMDAKRLYQRMGVIDRWTAKQLERAIVALCEGG